MAQNDSSGPVSEAMFGIGHESAGGNAVVRLMRLLTLLDLKSINIAWKTLDAIVMEKMMNGYYE